MRSADLGTALAAGVEGGRLYSSTAQEGSLAEGFPLRGARVGSRWKQDWQMLLEGRTWTGGAGGTDFEGWGAGAGGWVVLEMGGRAERREAVSERGGLSPLSPFFPLSFRNSFMVILRRLGSMYG